MYVPCLILFSLYFCFSLSNAYTFTLQDFKIWTYSFIFSEFRIWSYCLCTVSLHWWFCQWYGGKLINPNPFFLLIFSFVICTSEKLICLCIFFFNFVFGLIVMLEFFFPFFFIFWVDVGSQEFCLVKDDQLHVLKVKCLHPIWSS